MLSLLLIAASSISVSPSVHRTPAPPTIVGFRCQARGTQKARADETPPAKKLGELPPANHVLTVARSVDGCTTPVVVRYGIGGKQSASR